MKTQRAFLRRSAPDMSEVARREDAHADVATLAMLHQFQPSLANCVTILLLREEPDFNGLLVIGDFAIAGDEVMEIHLHQARLLEFDVFHSGDSNARLLDDVGDDAGCELLLS